ncbi:ABC transporter substrate-binding protein [Vibrio tubiashii]|uniref:Amino acid ABC transporter substrate-binding protein n=2 Tax=Vibrio tubiashii TaxID=29498 RepID=F9TA66_9VIBR|nr:transporter substrate-binding domain-containing protein [Vibrio tubiashii]AIW16110.1 amino acid ABC transporter substrate-binding protein [Vibrio tubiashii ATCC 19109]EGU50337.1 amino acid ABC transporter/signal transduction system periplasmic protein [Vibrio tubiashii ATCC 19109]EIF03553.1 amino acid ABC transporter substrate-binding protein [Vibrio tubiashii NCIMB 1337 = ATCC 19106]
MLKQSFKLIALIFALSVSHISYANTVKLANGEWAPYQSKSLKEGGFITQIVREAFEAEGYTVEFDYMPWKRGFEEAKAGNYDGSLIWSKNPDREQHFLYSNPVITLSTALFQQTSKPVTWSNREDLSSLKIGGVTGYAYGIEDLEKAGTVKIQRIASAENNYKKLKAGRLDVVLEDMDVGMETVTKLGLTGAIEPNAKMLTERDYFVIISKNSPRNQELLDAFNRGLAKLEAEGKLEQYRQASIEGKYKQ